MNEKQEIGRFLGGGGGVEGQLPKVKGREEDFAFLKKEWLEL